MTSRSSATVKRRRAARTAAKSYDRKILSGVFGMYITTQAEADAVSWMIEKIAPADTKRRKK